MKFWLIVPWVGPEEMVELAREAEAFGFEGMMGADHAFVPRTMAPNYLYTEDGQPPIDGDMPYPDVWTTLAAMAMATERLKLSTAVYVLPLRNPIEVAKATGTIARLSGDRLILGAGSGWMKEEFDVYGVEFSTRGRRMNECVEVLRKLWAGGYVEHHGEFFDFPELAITPAPDAPVPIYFGGNSTLALRRAARIGQGWIGTGLSLEEAESTLEKLTTLRREYGRENEPFEMVCPILQVNKIDRIKELEERGLTSICFGFAYDYASPLEQKRTALEWFANEIMAKFDRD